MAGGQESGGPGPEGDREGLADILAPLLSGDRQRLRAGRGRRGGGHSRVPYGSVTPGEAPSSQAEEKQVQAGRWVVFPHGLQHPGDS